jgi:hypothetical protein
MFRIPLEALMFLCVYSVFMLFCVQVEALRRADPPSKESYRLCIGLRNRKRGQGPTKGCRAIDRKIGSTKYENKTRKQSQKQNDSITRLYAINNLIIFQKRRTKNLKTAPEVWQKLGDQRIWKWQLLFTPKTILSDFWNAEFLHIQIIFLSDVSHEYQMWCFAMGEEH